MEYAHWVEEQQKKISELRSILLSNTSEMELQLVVENVLSHYYELFRMRAEVAKADVFYLLSGMWRTSLERFFLWIGGFRPSELINVILWPLPLKLKMINETQFHRFLLFAGSNATT